MPQSDPGRVLVVGSGGREHALVWTLSKSDAVQRIYVAPGNGGTAAEPKAENVAIGAGDIDGLVAFAGDQGIGLSIIGPEDPLAAGIVDAFQAAGLTVFGPTQDAARIESSKAWAREFMAAQNIPHPRFEHASDLDTATRAIRRMGGRCVVKADGLAAGKGVIICRDEAAAVEAATGMLEGGTFGAAGASILIEECCEGPEVSIMAVCDGERYALLAPAQDHKRLNDGDRGPNTGGMGTYAPAPAATDEVMRIARRRIIEPVLRGMSAAGHPFQGCLFCGLMLTERGPVVIEYNARFGDPETQVQVPLMAGDLHALLYSAARGQIDAAVAASRPDEHAACVVLASRGYPESAETGFTVEGVEDAETVAGVKVLHAGTKAADSGAVTSGGRALNVVCVQPSLMHAVRGAYEAIDDPASTPGPGGVSFTGMHYRRDIAYQAIAG